jgi:mono/diheme cytochrome c family protein
MIQTAYGKSVYTTWCAPCHDAKDLHLVKDPPRLGGLFFKPALPSGKPATDEQVEKVIEDGQGIMPPFRNTLNATDVSDLILYLHTLKQNPDLVAH